jgi:hypothetical protein
LFRISSEKNITQRRRKNTVKNKKSIFTVCVLLLCTLMAAPALAVDNGIPDDQVVRKCVNRVMMGGAKLVVFTVPAAAHAGVDGLRYKTDSPLEATLLPRLCRGVNTFGDRLLDYPTECLHEMLTPGQNEQYTHWQQLGILSGKTIKFGPVAQVFRTSAYTVPAFLGPYTVYNHLYGWTQAGSNAFAITTGYFAGIPIAYGVDKVEKALQH